jgi:hypothetical protein
MRSKSRAKRSNTELNPLIGDFINTIDPQRTSSAKLCHRPILRMGAERSAGVLQSSTSTSERWGNRPASLWIAKD